MAIEQLAPPAGTLAGHSAASESPRPSDGGSFIYSQLVALEGNRLPFTPTDELTGIPLPFHPNTNVIDSGRFRADEHHPWHPRRDPHITSETLGGRALRFSRIQQVNYDEHHDYYHLKFHGPALPEDEHSRFRLVVLSAAGYIPAEALAFRRSKKPYAKPLSNEERTKLWESGRIRVDRPAEVQRFLRDYTYQQDLSDINEVVIEEFMQTTNQERRWELGNQLLARAVYQATEPLRDTYRAAKRAERIPPQKARAVSRFVLSSLAMRRHRDIVFDELEQHLARTAV